MATYLDVDGFKLLTIMPSADVDELEVAEPGWLLRRLTVVSAEIDRQLALRYAVPFTAPAPTIIELWLVDLVTPFAYLKRGTNPSDEAYLALQARADKVSEEIAQAANAETGLFQLPLRADTTATGITKGSELDEIIAKVRAAKSIVTDAAPAAAEAADRSLKAELSAGNAPSGKKWSATKAGGRPLKNAAASVKTKAVGTSILMRVTGHHFFHHAGKGHVPVRQVVPTELPPKMGKAISGALSRHFQRVMA